MLKKLKTQHREIARLTFEGCSVSDISARLGLAKQTVYAITNDALFKAYVDNLNDKADDDVVEVRKRLAGMNTMALDVFQDILTGNDTPKHVMLRAAESVLDRNGFKPAEKHEHMHGHFTKADIEELKRRSIEMQSSDIIEAEQVQ